MARYGRPQQHDLDGAVEKMPRLLPTDAATETDRAALRATSTDASTNVDGAYTLFRFRAGWAGTIGDSGRGR